MTWKDESIYVESETKPSQKHHLGALPAKLTPWHEYAQKVVAAMRSKTPKIVFHSAEDRLTQCVLFVSGDFEVRTHGSIVKFQNF